jgi:hypothetical protein
MTWRKEMRKPMPQMMLIGANQIVPGGMYYGLIFLDRDYHDSSCESAGENSDNTAMGMSHNVV